MWQHSPKQLTCRWWRQIGVGQKLMLLPSLFQNTSLLKNIFRLRRFKELKGHECLYAWIFFRYKFQKELGKIWIDGQMDDRHGGTAKESGVTICFLEVSWSSQIFPVPRMALLSYIFSLWAENNPDLSLPGRKQSVSLQLSDKIKVTSQCLQFFSSSSTSTFCRRF